MNKKTGMQTFNKLIKSTTLFILTIALTLTACSSNEDGMGTMRVSLTDAPALYNEVNIEIHQVLVREAGDSSDGDEETEGKDDDELEDEGWKVIFNDTLIVNLLDYQNGATLDLGEVDLEAGQYDEMRLVLGDENTVVLSSGSTATLNTPSGQSSGIKIKINAAIDADEVYELIIDFDASQSVVARGNGEFNLKPVIRVIEPEDNGSISGVVRPLEASPMVYAIADSDTMGTQVDENGNFRIIGLEEGEYEISIQPTNEMYADSSFTVTLETESEFAIQDTVFLKMANQPNM